MHPNHLTAQLADSLTTILALEGYDAMWWVTEHGEIRLITNASSHVARSLATLVGVS